MSGFSTVLSHLVVSDSATPWIRSPPGSSVLGDSPGKNTGVGCHALLQGDLPNPGLLYCRQILYHLSQLGHPRILEWAAYPFSRGPSWSRNPTGVSCIAGCFFTSRATQGSPLVTSFSQSILWSVTPPKLNTLIPVSNPKPLAGSG